MRQTDSDPTPLDPTRRVDPTRRQMLRGGVAAAAGLSAAVTLSACGGGEAAEPSATPSSGGNPITVAKADVPQGAGIILDGYVVTQPAAGEFRAFGQTCPHQGCLVSMIRNGNIVCACHTSLFAISDGERVSGPARRGLTEVLVVDDGDNLLVG